MSIAKFLLGKVEHVFFLLSGVRSQFGSAVILRFCVHLLLGEEEKTSDTMNK